MLKFRSAVETRLTGMDGIEGFMANKIWIIFISLFLPRVVSTRKFLFTAAGSIDKPPAGVADSDYTSLYCDDNYAKYSGLFFRYNSSTLKFNPNWLEDIPVS